MLARNVIAFLALILCGCSLDLHAYPPQVTNYAEAQHATSAAASVQDVTAHGALCNGYTNDTAAVNAAISASNGGTITFPAGVCLLNATVSTKVNIRGQGQGTTTLISYTSNGAALTFTDRDTSFNFRTIQDLTFGRGETSDARIGVRFGGDSYAINDEWTGRYTFQNVNFCTWTGVLKQDGNIGNRFVNCNFSNAAYNYYAYNRSGAVMHAGNDIFSGCHFITAACASIYINSPTNAALQMTFNDCVIEYNPGFGIFVKAWAGDYQPGIIFNNTWIEGNAFASNASISHTGPSGASTTFTPKDGRIENCRTFFADRSTLRLWELFGATMTARDCFFESGWSIAKDSSSLLIVNGGGAK